MGENDLPVPPEFFSAFARWHRLSMMRNPRTLREISEVARLSTHPERLNALINLIEDEQGFALYQAVSDAKMALSKDERTMLHFSNGDFSIIGEIRRSDFEAWIAPELARMAEAVDAALKDASVMAGNIDQVFLTGGTSFVPAVRRLFDQRFGAERVTSGGELVSVAEGLALIGMERR